MLCFVIIMLDSKVTKCCYKLSFLSCRVTSQAFQAQKASVTGKGCPRVVRLSTSLSLFDVGLHHTPSHGS